EAEVLGPRLVDRPAALPLRELEQCAAAPVVNRNLLGLRCRKGFAQHLALRDHRQPPPVALWLRARELGGAPHLPREHVARARQSHAIHLADHGIASDPNLARDLTAGEPGIEAASELLDTIGAPG